VLGFSYSKIKREIDFPHRIGNTTVQVNVKQLHTTIAKWPKDQIILGSKVNWDEAVTDIKLHHSCQRSAFGSTAPIFLLPARRQEGKKSPFWSGKMGQPYVPGQ
jgi:hypothetical protein